MKSIAKTLLRSALTALAVSMAASSLAATITYTLTGTGGARIGNASETGAFVVTGIGDTANLSFPFNPSTPTVTLSSFTVAWGSNIYTASNTIRFFSNKGQGIAGFNDVSTQDVLNFSSAVYLSYDAISNAGPISSIFTFSSNLATTSGQLNWVGPSPTGLIFRAVVRATSAVPEPTSWAMIIAGFGLAGGALRRRAKVTVSYA